MSDQKSKTVMVPQGPDTGQMTARDGQRVEAAPSQLTQGHQPGGGGPEPGRRRLTPIAWLAAAVAVVVAVILVIAGVTATDTDSTPVSGDVQTIVEPTVGPQEYLNRLANQGYIPKEAVDGDQLLLERLANRGDIPEASLESGASDQLLRQLANEGRIPPEAAR